MKKIFDFAAPHEHYKADTGVVWCYDERIRRTLYAFFDATAIQHPDIIKVAGGARSLASPEHETDREYIIDLIKKSVMLHGTKKFILTNHADCGAYGGSVRFNNDQEAERSFHEQELAKARDIIHTTLPDLIIECLFVDFDGIWQIAN